MAINEPFIVPYYHDFYPTSADPKTPSSVQRSESWKDNPHYSGDNARDMIYPDAFPQSTTNKVMNGEMKFDANNEVWKHTDEEITIETKKYLTEKYGMENYDILITVDRVQFEVRYEAVISDSKKINSKSGEPVYYDKLPNKIEFISDPLQINLVKNRIKEAGFNYEYDKEDIWIKDNENQAHLKVKPEIILKWGGKIPNPLVSVIVDDATLKRINKDKKQKSKEGETFNNLKDGSKFVFKDAAPILRKYHVGWDEVLTKRGNVAVRKNGTEINIKDDIKIITEEEFNKEVKYKKDRFESFFDGLFSEYEIKKSNLGEDIKIPIDNFWKSMEDDEVFKNKFISLSTGPKDNMHGHYNGKYNNFVWTIDKQFCDLIRMEH